MFKVTSAATVNVGAILDVSHKQQQLTRQRLLMKQLRSLWYLVHQGLPIRGHDDKEGNLFQLLKLQRADDDELE